jgi:predicted dehydrogenase
MKNKLIIGVVGVGLTSHFRYHALKRIPKSKVELKGAYSKTPKNLLNFSNEMSTKAYSSLEELLKDSEINTISINTPNSYHYDIAKLALNNNKNVIVEYPLVTDSYKKAEKILGLASKKGLFIHVGHTMNYDNDLNFFKKNNKYIGNVLTGYRYFSVKENISFFNLSGKKIFYEGLGSWYNNRKISGGWIITAHYHYIQLFRRAIGEVVSVFSVDSSKNGIVMGSVLMKHENNASSVIQWGFPIPGRNFTQTIFSGTNGLIEINNNKYFIFSKEKVTEGIFSDKTLEETSSFVEDWKFLLKKIDSKKDMEKDNEDMLKVLKISISAQKSADLGRSIFID